MSEGDVMGRGGSVIVTSPFPVVLENSWRRLEYRLTLLEKFIWHLGKDYFNI